MTKDSVDQHVQEIINETSGGIVVRYSLAVEVLEDGQDDPVLVTRYSDNITAWAARGHAFIIEKDAWEGTI